MRIDKILLSGCLALTVLLSQPGCAFFTARRVATMAGKQVAKKVIKDAKKDNEEKKQAEDRKRRVREREQDRQRAKERSESSNRNDIQEEP